MKIFNKFIWSKKEPSNKNDIWFDGSTWRMYTEEAWQSFTLPVDAADKVAKMLENASEVYQEKLNAGYGIIIEGNTISLDVSSIDIDTTHNIGSIELFNQLIIDRSHYSLNEEDINAISEGKLITTTNKFNTKIPITTINHMTQADEVVGYYLVFYVDQILYRIYIDVSSCSIRGGLSIKENLSNKWLSTNDYTNEDKEKLYEVKQTTEELEQQLTELSEDIVELSEDVSGLEIPLPQVAWKETAFPRILKAGEIISDIYGAESIVVVPDGKVTSNFYIYAKDTPYTLKYDLVSFFATTADNGYIKLLGGLKSELSELSNALMEFDTQNDLLNDHNFQGEILDVNTLNFADNALAVANKDAMQSVWDYLNKLTPRTLIDSGKCGPTLYWELYSDGELKITGAGASYDFIKGVQIGMNRKSINKFVEDNPSMDYYGFHYDYDEFVGDGTTTSFNLANMPESVYFVMVDNVSRTRNSEFAYNVESGILTFNSAPSNGAKIKVAYPKIDNYYEVVKTFVGDGTNVRFGMEKLDVCNYVKVNGVELSSTEYAYDKLTGTLTFNAAPSSGANIEVQIAQYVAPWYRYRDEKDWGGYDTKDHYEISNPNHHIYNRININNGISYVGDWMFYRVCGPTKLEFPDSVKKMGIWCVRYTTTLRYLKLSKNLEEIGWFGISRNEKLLYIECGDKLAKIGACSFNNNPLLERLDLPNSVTELVEEYVMGGVYHDSSDWIYNTHNLRYLSLGSIEITKNNVYGLPYACASLQKVKMSENLTLLPEQSFVNCGSLESITIPNKVTTIGGSSFFKCTSLKEVYLDSETIASNINMTKVFPYCIDLYIHKDVVNISLNIPALFDKIMTMGDYVWYRKK